MLPCFGTCFNLRAVYRLVVCMQPSFSRHGLLLLRSVDGVCALIPYLTGVGCLYVPAPSGCQTSF
jgi:hypothetical protein